LDKGKLEKVMPKIYEKWAGPDVLVWVPYASRRNHRKDFERKPLSSDQKREAGFSTAS
jgi:hypothetical protein